MKRWQKFVAAVMLLFAVAFAAQTCSGSKPWYSRTEQKVDALTAMHVDEDGKSFFEKLFIDIGVIKGEIKALKNRLISSGRKTICTKEQVDLYAPRQGWVKKGSVTENKCPAANDNSRRISQLEDEVDAAKHERDEAKKLVVQLKKMLSNAEQTLDQERIKAAEQLATAQAHIQELEWQLRTLKAKANQPVVVPPKDSSCHPGARLRIKTETPVEAVKLRYLGQNREITSTVFPKENWIELKCVVGGEILQYNIKSQGGYILQPVGEAAQVTEDHVVELFWGPDSSAVRLNYQPIKHPEDGQLYFQIIIPSSP